MTTRPSTDEAGDAFVESASMEATFTSVKRTLVVGLFTAGVVIAGFLWRGGAPLSTTLTVVGLMMLSRMAAAWTASEGLKARTISEQRRWTRRLEYSLVPIGALSGLAPSALPVVDGVVPPEWFGLMVCSVAVVAANVLIGHGRTRTFLALSGPTVLGGAVSAALVGGDLAAFFAPGAVVVGAILLIDNHEAGAIYRDARRLEEENRSLVQELQGSNSALQHRVHTDALTGLSNRAGLRLHIASMADAEQTVDVVYIDLDGFKAVNDVHGHAAGDAILSTIGERLGRVVRSDDCAARLGGDEFAVIATVDGAPSGVVAARLHEVFAEPFSIGELELSLGASIGTHRCEPGDDIGLAMRLADAAMYDEKRSRQRASHRELAADASESHTT